MNSLEVLSDLNVGLGVAEQEAGELSSYFVETNQWRRIYRGEIDVVYGPKGAGKSALYTLLLKTPPATDNIVIIPADAPRGTPAFKKIEVDPPTTEGEFQALWKLYFSALIGNYLSEQGIKSTESIKLIDILASISLIDSDKATILSRIVAWLSNHKPSLEGKVGMDSTSGALEASGKLSFDDSNITGGNSLSINNLISLANEALVAEGKTAWIAIDRLDVAFIDNADLEENALRALFHAYLDMLLFENIKLKIFLRTDIWQRIINNKGFSEASHIVRQTTIEWPEEQLLNLLIRRLLNNNSLVEKYGFDREAIFADVNAQREAFYRIFPKQVVSGERRPVAFTWMLTRISDGTKQAAPRELIQLINSARDEEARNIETGASEATGEELFGGSSIKKALETVSRQRLDQTIYPEYPRLKPYIEQLEGQKAEQTVGSLGALWKKAPEETGEIVARLVEIGFFEKRGATTDRRTYWIPFIYRPALKITQGAADE